MQKIINKKVIGSAAFSAVTMAVALGAVSQTQPEVVNASVPETTTGASDLYPFAGVRDMSMVDLKNPASLVLNKEQADVTPVAAETQEVSSAWDSKVISTADDYVTIRSEASSESSMIGKLRAGDIGDIVSVENGWYQINSGNAAGYVSADYVATGVSAEELAASTVTTTATANDNIRVRTAPTTESEVHSMMDSGQTATVDVASSVDGWVAISVDDGTYYVSGDYVSVQDTYSYAITVEEEQAQIAAQQAAEAAAAAEANTVAKTQSSGVQASYDDVTLMAAIIQLEAGNEIYEGQVAVGAVIVNRLKSGRFPSTVSDVIYQAGQFYPASSPALQGVLASGPKASCMQAAQEALNGVDYTNGCLFFRSVRSGQSGVVIGNHVFY